MGESSPPREAMALIEQFYQCLQFDAGGSADFDKIVTLFHPDGRITPPIGDTGGQLQPMSPARFAEIYQPIFAELKEIGAEERQLSAEINHFKSTCQIISKYEFRTMDGTICKQGINNFQLVQGADHWWIISLTWDRY